MSITPSRGFTLVELIVAVGLFAFVMTLSSGAYLMMISLNRQAQGLATGIDNLSFALETMTRDIRTGNTYNCGSTGSGTNDCSGGASTFSFVNGSAAIEYSLADASIQETVDGVTSNLTDPSVTITALTFYVSGTSNTDSEQPRVTMVVTGTVATRAGQTQSFTVETGATMRGTDI